MLQITPQMRILVAIEAVDGRKGIDSLVQLCREKLDTDPFSGCVFIFRSRSATSIRLLAYDGQGFWLAQKRLSKGRFPWWPTGSSAARTLESYQAQLLLAAGNPDTQAAPMFAEQTPTGRPETDVAARELIAAERS
jgi:transposase